jgi:hypothetical protein
LATLLATLAGFVLALLLLTGLVLPALLLLARLVLTALLRVVLTVLRIVLFVSHRDVLRGWGPARSDNARIRRRFGLQVLLLCAAILHNILKYNDKYQQLPTK